MGEDTVGNQGKQRGVPSGRAVIVRRIAIVVMLVLIGVAGFVGMAMTSLSL
jgi:hypothetical protein